MLTHMKVACHLFNLPFRHPFRISKGSKTHQPGVLVELEHFGIRGYGEAPAISYYHITAEKMAADLEAKRPFVEKFAFSDPERYWHYLHHLFPDNPFLVCALDMAGWDLYGKIKRKPLYELWNLNPDASPQTDYTIGMDTEEKMLQKMQETDWPVYKIKVGQPADLPILRTLRRHTAAPFRVDANAGWTLTEALEYLPQLQELGVEMLEQPLAPHDWEGMQQLFAASPLPLFADESCVSEADVDRCAGHFHGINIKLTKCSGITPARRMISRARELGLQVMIGCMNESTVGTAAIAHLAPLVDMIDADGPLLLASDLATGIGYAAGKLRCSGLPGLGISLKPFNSGA